MELGSQKIGLKKLGMRVGPETPVPEISSGSDDVLGPSFESGGNVLRNCSETKKLLSGMGAKMSPFSWDLSSHGYLWVKQDI